MNLKYELTQEQIKQQSKVSAVPELTRLGRVISSLAPVVLSAQAEGTESYHVACIRHIFDSSLVLQFHITNNAKGQQMQNVRIHVESLSDADLYVHDSDVPLENLPFKSTGSCYVVFRTHPTIRTCLKYHIYLQYNLSVFLIGFPFSLACMNYIDRILFYIDNKLNLKPKA